ncbi:MAG: hypothetical protein CFE35_16350 [Novosphingobium sp. PASSN1]|nr:MAG: hypothetical protein CFE35_16350 [Novosphingobium sp. PASSN1]
MAADTQQSVGHGSQEPIAGFSSKPDERTLYRILNVRRLFVIKKFLSPIVAVAALVSAVPVVAASPLDVGVVSINYTNMDLSTAAGRAQLEARVNIAVRRACGDAQIGDRDEQAEIAACRAQARAAVEPQITAVVARASNAVALAR